jgi:hypothetical protein
MLTAMDQIGFVPSDCELARSHELAAESRKAAKAASFAIYSPIAVLQ